MDKAAQILAILIKRWTSKTPKGAKIMQVIMGIVGSCAFVTLSIPSLGLPVWASLGVGLIAYTSTAYEQLKTTNKDETLWKETKHLFPNKTKPTKQSHKRNTLSKKH